MALTTKSLKPDKKKPAPKKAEPKVEAPQPIDMAEGSHAELEDDHHNIPDRGPGYRKHDAVRGCWCFPEVKKQGDFAEVNHR